MTELETINKLEEKAKNAIEFIENNPLEDKNKAFMCGGFLLGFKSACSTLNLLLTEEWTYMSRNAAIEYIYLNLLLETAKGRFEEK